MWSNKLVYCRRDGRPLLNLTAEDAQRAFVEKIICGWCELFTMRHIFHTLQPPTPGVAAKWLQHKAPDLLIHSSDIPSFFIPSVGCEQTDGRIVGRCWIRGEGPGMRLGSMKPKWVTLMKLSFNLSKQRLTDWGEVSSSRYHGSPTFWRKRNQRKNPNFLWTKDLENPKFKGCLTLTENGNRGIVALHGGICFVADFPPVKIFYLLIFYWLKMNFGLITLQHQLQSNATMPSYQSLFVDLKCQLNSGLFQFRHNIKCREDSVMSCLSDWRHLYITADDALGPFCAIIPRLFCSWQKRAFLCVVFFFLRDDICKENFSLKMHFWAILY